MKGKILGATVLGAVLLGAGYAVKSYITIKEKKLLCDLAQAEQVLDGLKSSVDSVISCDREMFDNMIISDASGTYNELRDALIEARHQTNSILTEEFPYHKEKISEVLALAGKLRDMGMRERKEYFDKIESELK